MDPYPQEWSQSPVEQETQRAQYDQGIQVGTQRVQGIQGPQETQINHQIKTNHRNQSLTLIIYLKRN